MELQEYKFIISPENIKSDLVFVSYTGDTDITTIIDPCCLTATTISATTTGTTGVYLPMDYLLSGNTGGTSFLTGLSVNIMFTESAVDFGYYTPTDGLIIQADVLNNFIVTANTLNPYTFTFYNTSDLEFIKFLQLSKYSLDWGDGSPIQPILGITPLSHTYPTAPNTYTITLTASSPWGISKVEKTVITPYTNVVITNPQGSITFYPAGGTWTGTPISYDYIFTGDSNTDINDYYSYNYTSVPFVVTGFTESTLNDLAQYGPKINLAGGKYKLGVQVTGTTGEIGTYWGVDPTGLYSAYTINGVNYFDYEDYTIYITESYGLVPGDLVLSALTKNEALLNVIDEPEIITNVFVERGKYTALENVMRLGEVDNVGDLEKYGYKYFNVEKVST
jgi:hypothetical protein